MENLENVLNKVRETGKGYVNNKFKENPTHVMGGDLLKDGYWCPHCKQYDMNKNSEVIDRYEIPSDIEFMFNHTEYSWTEDCRCKLCGGLYSHNNGC